MERLTRRFEPEQVEAMLDLPDNISQLRIEPHWDNLARQWVFECFVIRTKQPTANTPPLNETKGQGSEGETEKCPKCENPLISDGYSKGSVRCNNCGYRIVRDSYDIIRRCMSKVWM